jgi:hypothetical protein
MPVRSLSRALRTTVAAGALTLAVSGPALAMTASNGNGNGNANITAGTDVAAPDQQNPIPPQTRGPVPQPAPTWPVDPQLLTPPQTVSASAGSDFQWDDAGIGAGGALVVVLAGLGGTLAIRRRHVSDPPLAA